jgi:hypothetical protein
VRSGTTLTRDLLRRVPGVICPEETHFLRWSEPFRTPASMPPHTQNQVLRHHREIDGVPEAVFARLLETCRSKAELQRAYVAAFARARASPAPYRWIDKTPQNIYGGALILAEFPDRAAAPHRPQPAQCRGEHAARAPGGGARPAGRHQLLVRGGQIAATLRKAAPDRIMDLRYEDLVADVPGAMGGVLRFAGLPAPAGLYRGPTPIPNGTSGATRLDRPNARGRRRTMRRAGPDPWLRPGGLRRFARSPLDLPVTGRP